MSARPTPERLAEIRAAAAHGAPDHHARHDLLAEVDALTARVHELEAAMRDVGLPETASVSTLVQHHRANAGIAAAIDAQNKSYRIIQSLTAERDEARAILSDLYALAQYSSRMSTLPPPKARFEAASLLKLRDAVLERCRPKGGP